MRRDHGHFGIVTGSAQGGEQHLTRRMEALEGMYRLTRRKGQADTYNTAWTLLSISEQIRHDERRLIWHCD